jgi:L-fucose mutarotase
MLRYRLTHPDILRALGTAGHGSQILIADGNYPFATGAHPAAARVWLNLAPGLLTVPDVLAVLTDALPIEAAHVMVPDAGPEPAVFDTFRRMLPGLTLDTLGRFPFYAAARGSDVALVIATGEQRVYANLLLTIGVVPPASDLTDQE